MAGLHNPAGLSPVIAGAWRLPDWPWTPQQRLAWIEGNLDIGVTSIDHADTDGHGRIEPLLGEALALRPALRQRLQLVGQCSVVPPQPLTVQAQVRAAVEQSLRALRTDHLDLLLVHRPGAGTDLAALAQAFDTLRRAGQVRHFGASQCTPQQLAALHLLMPLATHQVTLSPLQPQALEDGTLDQCQALGLRPMVWSPLAGGRVFTGQDEDARRLRAALQVLAAELGVSTTTLAIAWVLHHPSRPLPILGSRRTEVAQQALAALSLRLSAAQWQRLSAAAAGPAPP